MALFVFMAINMLYLYRKILHVTVTIVLLSREHLRMDVPCVLSTGGVVVDDLKYANGQQFVPQFSLERIGLRNRLNGFPR